MLKPKDPRVDLGKWAEKKVKGWLEARSSCDVGLAYHRYPDARAARGALAAQPADFLVAYKTNLASYAIHLEVKETAQTRRLPRDKISQIGKLKLFHLAGFKTLVVVYRSKLDDWTWFTPADLFGEGCDELKSFLFVEGRSIPNVEQLLDTLIPKK